MDVIWRGRQLKRFALLLSMILVVGACSKPHEFAGTYLENPSSAPNIMGINWDGAPFHLQELQGQVVLLFFGFTYCPDVCPLALAEMQQVKQQLGEQADKTAVVFVSVDPERDTVERLAEYIQSFDSTFYGVRLDEATLATAQEAYGIYAERLDNGAHVSGTTNSMKDMKGMQGMDAMYSMDHSGYTLVIDRTGKWRGIYSADVEAAAIVKDIRYLITE